MSNGKLLLEKEVTINSLFGNQIVPEKIVLAGMKDLENELDQSFKRDQQNRELAARQTKILQRSLLSAIGGDAGNTEVMKQLKELSSKRGKMKPKPAEMARDEQRIFTGSIGATQVPPFDYKWTWHASTGTVDTLNKAANVNGNMSFDIQVYSAEGTCSARTAVGIFFRPMTKKGILKIWANPAINYQWSDLCNWDSAHSDGFLGLYVGRYDLSGGFVSAPVNQKISLWDDSSWWYGQYDMGSNSGFPLFSQLNVDSNHWYALWVWCGGHIEAAGLEGAVFGSNAGATLSVAVPSITWELI